MTAQEIIKLAFFEGKQIRKIIHEGEWWFAIVDVVEVLTESPTPRQYWGKLKSGSSLIFSCPRFGYN